MNHAGIDPEWARTARKSEIVVEIAKTIGVTPPPMSTGSTEPRAIFALVNDRLGLGLDQRLPKAELAAAIVASSGASWHPDYESRGATVTKDGLLAVLATVLFYGQD
jgi:hypothetical protein